MIAALCLAVMLPMAVGQVQGDGLSEEWHPRVAEAIRTAKAL